MIAWWAIERRWGERSHQDYRLVLVATVVLMTVLAGLVIGLPFSDPLAR